VICDAAVDALLRFFAAPRGPIAGDAVCEITSAFERRAVDVTPAIG